MKIAVLILASTSLACRSGAQTAPTAPAPQTLNILLKDGKTIVTKGLRRQGDTIMATVDIRIPGSGTEPAKVQTGELGYPVDKIAKLDFPEPAVLQTVPDLIASGKAGEALTQLEPVVRYFGQFRDAPGSWWPDAVLLKLEALHAMGNFKEADPLTDNLSRVATDPETIRAAKVFVAGQLTRRGDHAKAIKLFQEVLKETNKPMTLATAAVNMGQSQLALKEYDSALLSFLQIPVFYPRHKMLLTQAMLGAGRAYFGLEDFPRAKATLDELIKDYSTSPQVADAKAELEKIAKREKALAVPK
ncbi:MAG: tetratricopeptide repeat protein [Chthoniobacter sp.]|nr:tetratricopeptide repeat protein [Chthoniobacter sp.]